MASIGYVQEGEELSVGETKDNPSSADSESTGQPKSDKVCEPVPPSFPQDLNYEIIEVINRLIIAMRPYDGTVKGITVTVTSDGGHTAKIRY